MGAQYSSAPARPLPVRAMRQRISRLAFQSLPHLPRTMADSATIAEPASAKPQGTPASTAAQGHPTDLAQLTINTIRTLSMDAVQAANSGHPGTPMSMAPVAYTLWQEFLRFDPEDPIWPNRDRFVLSAGHASMLLYSLLHLSQVKAVDPEYETLGKISVTFDEIKNF